MPKPLFRIIKKEVLEMVRDPRLLLAMIIVPLLMFPVMGLAMSASVSSIEDSASSIELGVVNLDGDYYSLGLQSYLRNKQVRCHDEFGIDDLNSMFDGYEGHPMDLFMVIPHNFTSAIETGNATNVTLYTSLKTYSISEGIPADTVAGHILGYQQSLLDDRLIAAFPGQDASLLKNPFTVESNSIVKGEVRPISPADITSQMMIHSMMVPMVLMILLIIAAQLAATSVAMEKEEKTLETLLTTPVPRSTILFGKIAGVVVISAIAVVAYVFGFSFYMSSIMSSEGAGIDLASIGLAPTLPGMGILLVTLFLSLVSALSLSVLVASFTEDVRSAQALLGVIYVPIFIPAIVLMLIDLSQLPGIAQAAIMAIPFTYPVLAAKAMYTGEFGLILFGIIYQVIFTIAIIHIASWIFSSEKIMTARLNFKKRNGPFLKKRENSQ